MALQHDYINQFGETVQDCYWKIGVADGISGGKFDMVGKLYCYENKEQADLNQNELYVLEIEFYYDFHRAENIMMQIYEEIKEHKFFEGAIDV